jgi:hypothetical protein
MATEVDSANVSLSEEAYEVLGCLSEELGETVLRLASWIAQMRRKASGQESGQVIVERGDVEDASQRVIQSIEQAIRDGHLPKELLPVIEGTKKCLHATLKKESACR